jgi:D-alanyl-D-alanine carboxypeptidase
VTRRFVVLCVLGALVSAACSDGSSPQAAAPTATVDDLPVVAPVSPSPEVSEPPAPAEPRFQGEVRRIGPEMRRLVVGRSWRPGCPVPLGDLRHVEVSYWDFEGEVRSGPLIVHEEVAADLLWVFRRLFRARFPIWRIVLPPRYRPPRPEDYWDRQPTSPTAAYNCRPATGSTVWSQHAYGLAIDINPLQNPYVRSDGSTLRHIAKPYRNRSLDRKGMIHDRDVVVRSFAAIGWEWGGHWHTLKDYMHFSLNGR